MLRCGSRGRHARVESDRGNATARTSPVQNPPVRFRRGGLRRIRDGKSPVLPMHKFASRWLRSIEVSCFRSGPRTPRSSPRHRSTSRDPPSHTSISTTRSRSSSCVTLRTPTTWNPPNVEAGKGDAGSRRASSRSRCSWSWSSGSSSCRRSRVPMRNTGGQGRQHFSWETNELATQTRRSAPRSPGPLSWLSSSRCSAPGIGARCGIWA